MDNREKINDTSLQEKEDFYSHLNMKDILMQIIHTKKDLAKNLKSKI